MKYHVWCEDFSDEDGAVEVDAGDAQEAVCRWARALEADGEPLDVEVTAGFVVNVRGPHGLTKHRLFAQQSIDYTVYDIHDDEDHLDDDTGNGGAVL